MGHAFIVSGQHQWKKHFWPPFFLLQHIIAKELLLQPYHLFNMFVVYSICVHPTPNLVLKILDEIFFLPHTNISLFKHKWHEKKKKYTCFTHTMKYGMALDTLKVSFSILDVLKKCVVLQQTINHLDVKPRFSFACIFCLCSVLFFFHQHREKLIYRHISEDCFWKWCFTILLTVALKLDLLSFLGRVYVLISKIESFILPR